MGEATPRPWRVGPKSVIRQETNNADGSRTIVWVAQALCTNTFPPGQREANAALIVRAVNSHEALVEALRDARRIIAELDEYQKRPERGDYGAECACCMGELFDDDRDAIARIEATLALAEQQP